MAAAVIKVTIEQARLPKRPHFQPASAKRKGIVGSHLRWVKPNWHKWSLSDWFGADFWLSEDKFQNVLFTWYIIIRCHNGNVKMVLSIVIWFDGQWQDLDLRMSSNFHWRWLHHKISGSSDQIFNTRSWSPFQILDFVLCAIRAVRLCDTQVTSHQ